MSIASTLESPTAQGPQPAQDSWHTCQLEEHLVELRVRHALVSGFVDNLVPPAIRQTLRLYCADVEELLEHLEGLHDDDCLVGLLGPEEA